MLVLEREPNILSKYPDGNIDWDNEALQFKLQAAKRGVNFRALKELYHITQNKMEFFTVHMPPITGYTQMTTNEKIWSCFLLNFGIF
jgi:hypothetical protein